MQSTTCPDNATLSCKVKFVLAAVAGAFLTGALGAISETARDLMKGLLRRLGKHLRITVLVALLIGIVATAGVFLFQSDQGSNVAESLCPPGSTDGITTPKAVLGVDPNIAGPSAPIIVTGAGFEPAENVNVQLLRIDGSTTNVVIAGSRGTSINGSLIPWRIEVPPSAVKGERYTIKAEGPSGACAITTLTVK